MGSVDGMGYSLIVVAPIGVVPSASLTALARKKFSFFSEPLETLFHHRLLLIGLGTSLPLLVVIVAHQDVYAMGLRLVGENGAQLGSAAPS